MCIKQRKHSFYYLASLAFLIILAHKPFNPNFFFIAEEGVDSENFKHVIDVLVFREVRNKAATVRSKGGLSWKMLTAIIIALSGIVAHFAG